MKYGALDFYSELNTSFPYKLMKSYLQDRTYNIKFNTETSTLHQIHSGVPQGSILGPLLYTLYTSNLPTSQKTVISTFADDTAVVAMDADPTTASRNLRRASRN